MAYDEGRRALTVFGGEFNGRYLQDVWELSEAGWREVALERKPAARHRGALTYDPSRQAIVLYGGTDFVDTLDDLWHLQFTNPALTHERCEWAGVDIDGDGLVACGDAGLAADPDCWGRCTPACPPWVTAQANGTTLAWPAACAVTTPALRCGDGVCASPREDAALCPADCAP